MNLRVVLQTNQLTKQRAQSFSAFDIHTKKLKIPKPYISLHQDLIIQKKSLERKVSSKILCGTSTVSSMKEGSHHHHRHHHLAESLDPRVCTPCALNENKWVPSFCFCMRFLSLNSAKFVLLLYIPDISGWGFSRKASCKWGWEADMGGVDSSFFSAT
jgi:hypothetical protein